MPNAATIEEHLAALPAARRAVMDELRRTIRAAAPDAAESIAYAMPSLRTAEGRFLVSYESFSRHYSLFPASGRVIAELGSELTPYLSGRATLKFPASSPVPFDLVRRVVEIRVKETAEDEA